MTNKRPLQITIIGGGFCGVITTVNLLRSNSQPLHINIINNGNPIARGVAYSPNNSSLLLNVPNGKMSAFPNEPDHFLNWLKQRPGFKGQSERDLTAGFAPRELYGNYLTQLWQEALAAKHTKASLAVYDDYAYDVVETNDQYDVYLKNNPVLTSDVVVLATGNAQPRLPPGVPPAFSRGAKYFGDPWKRDGIDKLHPKGDVLIVGNGLTMADTVVALVEAGFKNTIYTVSPHGYNLNIFKENKAPYQGWNVNSLELNNPRLSGLLTLLNKHRKEAQNSGQSAYPIVDSLRPHVQQIWLSFSLEEKQQFLKYLRHLWGSARHRLPAATHQFMAGLYAKNHLITYKGKVVKVIEQDGEVRVDLNCGGELKNITVQRIINCTGPEGNPKFSSNELLRNLTKSGLICADDLGMGIKADPSDGSIISCSGEHKPNLFTIGPNLKGILWESTAVPELRVQAKNLASLLAEKARQHQLSTQNV